jgi:hypothetical protein
MKSKMTESALAGMDFLELQEDSKLVKGAPIAIVAMAAALVFFKKSLLGR